MSLTPLFFWNDGDSYLYLKFWWQGDCSEAGISNNSHICSVLKRCFFANTLLNIVLLIGFILTVSTIILAIMMMKRYFFRFTNVFILFSGLFFIITTGVWYLISGSWNPDVSPGDGLLFIPLAGLNELLCYSLSRWYTYKLYDANFVEDLLNNSEYTEENSSNNKSSVSEQDSVLL